MAQFSSDTSGRSLLGWVKALVVLTLGLIVAHLGITLFLLTDLGSDPFTVMIQGLARVSGLTVGTMHVIVSCLLMGLMLLFTKGYVKPGTVICAFCGGPIIDCFSWLLGPYLSGDSPMALRLCGVVPASLLMTTLMPRARITQPSTTPHSRRAMGESPER